MEHGGLMSHGSIIKEEGRVLQELADKLKKPSNVSCRIEKFGNVVEGFCSIKRRWICEMGFEGLLSLAGCRLPRSLCYWLATRVDCKKKELVSVDRLKFPLSKVQINWVYGLPYGPKAVPNQIKGKRMKAIEKEVWDQFGCTTSEGTMCISGQSIVDAVDKPADNETYFKRAFLMLALNEILCPTTCYRLSVKLIPAVTVSTRANEYDWCSLVLDHLLYYLARFAKQFDSKGYVAGCGGCTHFLAVLYLDKLNRSPLSWGAYPRVKFWSNREVNKALSEDKIPHGDYGRLGCIDVAYGEPHPQEARDLFPQARGAAAAPTTEDRVANKFYTVRQRVYRKKKRNKATNGNPYARKLNKLKRPETGDRNSKGRGNVSMEVDDHDDHVVDDNDDHVVHDHDDHVVHGKNDHEVDDRDDHVVDGQNDHQVDDHDDHAVGSQNDHEVDDHDDDEGDDDDDDDDHEVSIETGHVWSEAVRKLSRSRNTDVVSEKERSCRPRTPVLSLGGHELASQDTILGQHGQAETNISAEAASPNSDHVDRLVDRISGDEGHLHLDTDDTNPITPSYQWGSLVLSPCKRRVEIDPSDASGHQVSIDSTQYTYASEEFSDCESEAFIEIQLSPPPGFAPLGPVTGNQTDKSPSAGLQTPITDKFQFQGEAMEGSPSTSPRTLVQRVTKAPVKFSPQYIKAWRSTTDSRLKMKLANVVLKSLRSFEDDPVLFECDGWCAHLSSVSAVLLTTGFIDVKYVSTASKINSKVWAGKSSGRSKKVMFTPHFAIDALESALRPDVHTFSCDQHVHQLSSCEARKINAIFIPVIQRRVWWAVAFSLNRREIRLMDPSGQMEESIRIALPSLQSALKNLIEHVFPSWTFPDTSEWKVVVSEFHQRSNKIGSGVAMLMAFKSCEDRFNAKLIGRLDFKQRSWLLAEDLMSEHNNARETCKALLRGVPLKGN